MILYLSSLIDDESFARHVKGETIKGGHQAQKFNSLVARGLATFTSVSAISNPPYNKSRGAIPSKLVVENNVKYISVGSNSSKLHKLRNFTERIARLVLHIHLFLALVP